MKFRTETRHKTVEHEINGRMHRITVPEEVRLPKLTRDLAATVRQAMWAATAVVVLAAIVWSATAISALLALAAPLWAAVMIAAVFDLGWVVAMGAEWSARFEPEKARGPRRAGFLALVVSVALIVAHGWHFGELLSGIAGALVSVMAKLMWHVVLGATSVRLSPADRAWVSAEMSRAGTTLALAAVRRQVAAAERTAALELLAAEREGLDLAGYREAPAPAAVRTASAPVELEADTSGHVAEGEADVPVSVALTSPDTVRTSDRAVPSIAALARAQAAAGVDDKAAVAAVLAVRPDAKADTILRSVRRERSRLESTGQGGYL